MQPFKNICFHILFRRGTCRFFLIFFVIVSFGSICQFAVFFYLMCLLHVLHCHLCFSVFFPDSDFLNTLSICSVYLSGGGYLLVTTSGKWK